MVLLKSALMAFLATTALAAKSYLSSDAIERDIIARALDERQYSPSSTSAPSSQTSGCPPSSPTDKEILHIVKVSNDSAALMYFPQYIMVPQCEWVQFQFYPKNHTVTQSTFDQPCMPMPNGLKSGFVPVEPNPVNRTVLNYQVQDTKPVWFYCGQKGHCQKGMVFAINPMKQGKTFDAFFQNAVNNSTVSSSSSSAATTIAATTAATGAATGAAGAGTTSSASGPSIATGTPSVTGPGTFTGIADAYRVQFGTVIAGLALAGIGSLL